MKNTKETEYYKKELEKENLIINKHILEREKLIEEQKQILDTERITINNSFMSLTNYNKFSNKRKEDFIAKTNEIHAVEDKIKESSKKISNLEINLGMKKSKEVKKEYQTLCDRLKCEEQIRKHKLIETSLNDYSLLRENRFMLINKLEEDPSKNSKLLTNLKLEENVIAHQIDILESIRTDIIGTIDILNVNRNGLLDRQKQYKR